MPKKWQLSTGIGGNFGPECRQLSNGMSGNFAPDYAIIVEFTKNRFFVGRAKASKDDSIDLSLNKRIDEKRQSHDHDQRLDASGRAQIQAFNALSATMVWHFTHV